MKGKAPVDIECKAKLGKVQYRLSPRDMKLMIHVAHACGWTPVEDLYKAPLQLQFLL